MVVDDGAHEAEENDGYDPNDTHDMESNHGEPDGEPDVTTGHGSPLHEIQDGDSSSVTTTQPEQTPDHDDIEDGSHGMSVEEFKAFQAKYPRLAQKNPDGTQPDSQSPIHSPPMIHAEASGTGPSASMPPPQPPSPGTVQRKKDLTAKLAVLRWGGCKP